MRKLVHTSILSLSLLLAIPAAAETTQAEANRLKAVFETYLGNKAGVVNVAPQGEAYAVSLDPAPLLAGLPMPGASFTAKPYTFTAKPLGGGKWEIKGASPQALTFKMPGFLDIAWTSDSTSFSGIYDEALLAFTETNNVSTGDTYSQIVTAPEGRTEQTQRTAKSSSRFFDVSGTAENLSFTQEGAQEGVTGTYRAPLPGGGAIDAKFSIAKISGAIKASGLRNRQSMDLWAFAVANPSLEALKLKQEELRAKVKALLPLFKLMGGTAAYERIAVTTAYGDFGAGGLKATVNMDMDANLVGETVEVTGLSIPPGLAPAWAEPLLPVDANIGFVLGGARIASLLQALAENADLNAEKLLKPGSEPQLLAAIMPMDGKFLVSVKPARIKGRAYEITGTGDLTAALFGTAGTATVTMTGLDAVIASLATAGADPTATQFKQFAEMAKGLAKPGDGGALTWAIEGSQAKGISVNGTLVMPPPG